MKVLIFGATGMVGQGVLQECLRASDVTHVVTVGRSATGKHDPKLREILHRELYDYRAIESELHGFDACFFCLGVSSFRMSEAEYTRITYDGTMAAARTLARTNPDMTFIYVSGESTDSTERGSVMWARVKGRTENALQRLPFTSVYLFRPGAIQPLGGIRSKTALYRGLYLLFAPLMPLLRKLWPDRIITTEEVGRAMLQVARHGGPATILHSRDIAALGRVP